MLQALLAYLLARCGEGREATILAGDLERALPHPGRGARGSPLAAEPRQLRRRLLHGLRGAQRRRGARRQGALRRDVPRGAAADAARGARDPARARVRRADDRGGGAHAARRACARSSRRRSASSSSCRRRSRTSATTRRASSRRSATAIRSRRLVEIEYQKEGEETSSTRVVEPYVARARAAELDACTRGIARATASAASASTACARRSCSTRRSSRARASSRAGCATRAPRASSTRRTSRAGRSSAAPGRSRTASAVADLPVGSPEWLESEIFSYRGNAVVLEPEDLRTPHPRPREGARDGARRQPPARHDFVGSISVKVAPSPGTDRTSTRAAVRLGDRARDEEAEARSRPPRAALRAAELLEDHGLLVARDARPAVADARRRRGRSVRRPRRRPSRRASDHFTAFSIRFARTWRRRVRSPRSAGSGPCNVAWIGTSSCAERRRRDGLLGELADVEVVEPVGERARLDARRVEDVRDQVREPARLVRRSARGTTRAGRATARATAAAASAPRRSPPPSGCAARARRARRSPRAARRGAGAPRRSGAPRRTRGCSARRFRRAGRSARRARPPRS